MTCPRPHRSQARRRARPRLALIVAALAAWAPLAGVAACARGRVSERPPLQLNPNMDKQPKYLPQAESGFFYTGGTMQLPVPGTLARGALREDEEFDTGRSAWGFYLPEVPLEATGALIERGRDRYRIYCTPCHGERGDGQGILTTRGHVRTADLTQERVRQMPAGRIYHIISNGKGLMPGYRYPIRPEDRWAIVAFVRRLQREGGGD